MASDQPLSSIDPSQFASNLVARRQQATSDKLVVETMPGAAPNEQAKTKTKVAGQQFEAMFLRQMLEEFMPKNSDTIFGSGTAGTVWRSMLADSIATTMSKSSSLGLAQLVVNHDAESGETK